MALPVHANVRPAHGASSSALRLLKRAARCGVALLALLLWAPWVCAQNSMVRLQTSQGVIDIQLYDTAAPKTVANFLGYVRRGDYVNSFVHRSIPGFVIQGGGYVWANAASSIVHVPQQAAVPNEFSAARSNLRGTIAMAKLGGNPNSATSEWFVNLVNNANPLDVDNGGYTVFGKVTTSGMVVVDRIAALKTAYASATFSDLPYFNYVSGSLKPENLVRVTAAAVLPNGPAASDSDRVFNYLEAAYPQYLAPAGGSAAGTALGYYYRYYASTNAYVGTQDGSIFYLVPAISGDINRLGSLAEWLALAAEQGY